MSCRLSAMTKSKSDGIGHTILLLNAHLDGEVVGGGEPARVAVRHHREGVRAEVLVLRQPADQAVSGVHGQPAGRLSRRLAIDLSALTHTLIELLNSLLGDKVTIILALHDARHLDI